MTSQQPPEGLSAEELESACWIADHQPKDARELLHKIINAARSTSPAPDPEGGEREQVAEAVELRDKIVGQLAATSLGAGSDCVELNWTEGRQVLRWLSALAEARSEVERLNKYADALCVRCRAAEAERDTLAAQLVGAREALEDPKLRDAEKFAAIRQALAAIQGDSHEG